MTRSRTRRGRSHQPALEGLEGRKLLSTTTNTSATSGTTSPGRVVDVQNGIRASDRRLAYTTPQGTHVVVTLYGVGSLKGSTVDPDGALNLVFSETNQSTGIVAEVSGGTGHAPLRSIRHAAIPIDNLSGINSTLLNVVNLKDFDLVPGGQINITGGVHTLFLNSVAADSQINLRTLPNQFLVVSSGSTTNTANGVQLGFLDDVFSARTLTSIGGAFIPEVNFLAQANSSNSSNSTSSPNGDIRTTPAPPGAVISINHVLGPNRNATTLGDPMVYAYDPKQNALIRFDAVNGNQTGAIALPPAAAATTAGVGLAQRKDQTLVLVGTGSTVRAYNAETGAPVGQFSTANLGFNNIDGIGSTGTYTSLVDAETGQLQLIDLDASLASPTGQAVKVGSAFNPQPDYFLTGDATGISGSNTIYVPVAAHFDALQPLVLDAGIMALNTTGGKVSLTSATALKSNGAYVPAGQPGQFAGVGSVDQNLAVLSVVNGMNQVTLYSPSSLSANGTVTLADSDPLSGLSESYRPSLAGSALVDVQGNVQSFRAHDAQGLVLNVLGYLNLSKIEDSVDTTIVAFPFGHAEMPHRSDVTILSSTRTVANRNGVTVISNLEPAGPLSLP